MKTKKLKYKPEFNFELIGVSTSIDDYKFSWHMSKIINSDFVRQSDLEIIDIRFPDHQKFGVFDNSFSGTEILIKIVSNKSLSGFLIEELKNIDFFILSYDCEDSVFTDKIITELKTLPNISGVFKLDATSLRSKEKLLF